VPARSRRTSCLCPLPEKRLHVRLVHGREMPHARLRSGAALCSPMTWRSHTLVPSSRTLRAALRIPAGCSTIARCPWLTAVAVLHTRAVCVRPTRRFCCFVAVHFSRPYPRPPPLAAGMFAPLAPASPSPKVCMSRDGQLYRRRRFRRPDRSGVVARNGPGWQEELAALVDKAVAKITWELNYEVSCVSVCVILGVPFGCTFRALLGCSCTTSLSLGPIPASETEPDS
jgi:hypothetical protein